MQALGMLQQKASLRAPKNDPAAPEITFSAEQISEAEIAIIRCALAHALWMPDTQVVTFWDMPSQRAHWVRQVSMSHQGRSGLGICSKGIVAPCSL
jgi:hypothetical protein